MARQRLTFRRESDIPADLLAILSHATPDYETDSQTGWRVRWNGKAWAVTSCAVVSDGKGRCDVTVEEA